MWPLVPAQIVAGAKIGSRHVAIGCSTNRSINLSVPIQTHKRDSFGADSTLKFFRGKQFFACSRFFDALRIELAGTKAKWDHKLRRSALVYCNN
jgi:hypothetical protein